MNESIQEFLSKKETFTVNVTTDYGDRVEVQGYVTAVRLIGDRLEIVGIKVLDIKDVNIEIVDNRIIKISRKDIENADGITIL